MIATAKFTAALARARDSRPYTDAVRRLVGEVSGAAGEYDSPLFSAKGDTKKELLLVISSDRGLCGAYNGNVFKTAMQHIRSKTQDGADNFQTRYLINDASVKTGIPVVHGSIFQYEGQITVFDPKNGPT